MGVQVERDRIREELLGLSRRSRRCRAAPGGDGGDDRACQEAAAAQPGIVTARVRQGGSSDHRAKQLGLHTRQPPFHESLGHFGHFIRELDVERAR